MLLSLMMIQDDTQDRGLMQRRNRFQASWSDSFRLVLNGLWLSNNEKMLKIGPHLPKLTQK